MQSKKFSCRFYFLENSSSYSLFSTFSLKKYFQARRYFDRLYSMHVFCKVSCNFSKTVLSLQLVLSRRKTVSFKKRKRERERTREKKKEDEKKGEIYCAYAHAQSFRETSYRMQPRYSYFRFPVFFFLTKSACIARLYRAHVSCLFPLGDRALLQAEMLPTDSC